MASIDYTVGVNGVLSEKFLLSRGLGNGDPFSSYLFLIYAEGFSVILNDVKEKNVIKGVCLGKGSLAINHLFFINDSLLFGETSKTGAKNIQKIISTYELALRKKINFEKSFIFFGSNVTTCDRDTVSSILSVRTSSSPEKYLKLPMMVGRSRNRAFMYYVDRFRKRIKLEFLIFILGR